MAYRFARVVLRERHLVVVQARQDPQEPYLDSLEAFSAGAHVWDLRVTDFAWARAGLACMDVHCRFADAWDRTHEKERNERKRAYRLAIAKACGLVLPEDAVREQLGAEEEDAFTPSDTDKAVDLFLGSLPESKLKEAVAVLEDIPVDAYDEHSWPSATSEPPPEPKWAAVEPVQLVAPPAPALSTAQFIEVLDPEDLERRLDSVRPCGEGGFVGTKHVPQAEADLQHLGLVIKVSDAGVVAQCVGRVQTGRNAMPGIRNGKLNEGLWLSRAKVRMPADLAVGDVIRLTSVLRLNDYAKRETEHRVIDFVMSQDGLLVLPNF